MNEHDSWILHTLNDSLNDVEKVSESIRRARLTMAEYSPGHNVALDAIENTLPILQKIIHTNLNILHQLIEYKKNLPDTDFVSSST